MVAAITSRTKKHRACPSSDAIASANAVASVVETSWMQLPLH